MNDRQTSVTAVEILKVGSRSKRTKSGIFGGVGKFVENLGQAEIVGNIFETQGDIYRSNIDPTSLLPTVILQRLFKILQDNTWSWEYYVENFDETFFKEYLAYGILAALDAGSGQIPEQ